MYPQNELFNQLSGSFLKNALNVLLDNTNQKNKNMLLVLGIVLFSYAGVEGIKVVFRRNFGQKGIDQRQLILTIIGFVIVIFASFSIYYNSYPSGLDLWSKSSFFITGIAHSVIAIIMIFLSIKAISQRGKNEQIHPSYRGDSYVLGFLEKRGWTQAKIQNVAEPLLVLSIGVLLSVYNILLGIPLIFSALSVWIHYAYEAIGGLIEARDMLSDVKGMPQNEPKEFSEVRA